MLQKLYNPVLLKELKLRFRFFKSITGLVFYLSALLVFVGGFLLIVMEYSYQRALRPEESFILFMMLAMLQMALVLFITPGLTAGAISSEREKQTLNMLLMTTQSSAQIVIGKLTSSISYLGLLMIAGLPIYSIVFLFGGVSPTQFITVFFFYFVTMVAIASIGLFFSIVIKRTITSMIATYSTMVFLGGFTAFFFFVSLFLSEMSAMNTNQVTNSAPFAYFWASINPGALVLSILSTDVAYGLEEVSGIGLPIWIPYLIFYSALTAVMLLLSIKKLRVNMKRG